MKALYAAVSKGFEKLKAAYTSIDIDSTSTEELGRMYNKYADMVLAGFYVEGAQGRILGIRDLKLANAIALMRKGVVYTKYARMCRPCITKLTTSTGVLSTERIHHPLISPLNYLLRTYTSYGYQPISIWKLERAILQFFLGEPIYARRVILADVMHSSQTLYVRRSYAC